MDLAAVARRCVSVRQAARIERERALFLRHRARWTRRRAEELYDAVYARRLLAALAESDLSVLEDVRPYFRVIEGGRD